MIPALDLAQKTPSTAPSRGYIWGSFLCMFCKPMKIIYINIDTNPTAPTKSIAYGHADWIWPRPRSRDRMANYFPRYSWTFPCFQGSSAALEPASKCSRDSFSPAAFPLWSKRGQPHRSVRIVRRCCRTRNSNLRVRNREVRQIHRLQQKVARFRRFSFCRDRHASVWISAKLALLVNIVACRAWLIAASFTVLSNSEDQPYML